MVLFYVWRASTIPISVEDAFTFFLSIKKLVPTSKCTND